MRLVEAAKAYRHELIAPPRPCCRTKRSLIEKWSISWPVIDNHDDERESEDRCDAVVEDDVRQYGGLLEERSSQGPIEDVE